MLEGIKARLKGKIIILGIGNTLRSDDGVGSLLAAQLKDKVPFELIDAGSAPENYLEKIIKIKPETIIIIDAVDFGGNPGEIKILREEDLKSSNLFFTHNASLSMSINYLKKSHPADIIILIIQPKNINFNDKLSPEVSLTLEKLKSFFIKEAGYART